jgi:hypothetical protein
LKSAAHRFRKTPIPWSADLAVSLEAGIGVEHCHEPLGRDVGLGHRIKEGHGAAIAYVILADPQPLGAPKGTFTAAHSKPARGPGTAVIAPPNQHKPNTGLCKRLLSR